MEVTRLTKRNHYEEITDQIRQLIADGTLKVGDKLPSTKEMSERFGVGRSTTREALSALKAMGLIEIRQGGGCRVISSTPIEVGAPELESIRLNRETLLELMEARQSLEVSNAALAAARRTDDDMEELREIIAEMGRVIGDDVEGERTDLRFHLTLAKATHNGILVRLFESIQQPLEKAIRDLRRAQLYANRSVSNRLYEEHTGIVEAIEARNPELAAARMKEHLLKIESILTKFME